MLTKDILYDAACEVSEYHATNPWCDAFVCTIVGEVADKQARRAYEDLAVAMGVPPENCMRDDTRVVPSCTVWESEGRTMQQANELRFDFLNLLAESI